MEWWIWFVLGFGLLASEVVVAGTFVLLFFGLGAMTVGALALAGVAGPLWGQLGLFGLVSAASFAMFRRRLIAGMKPAHELEHSLADVVGGTVVVDEDIPPGGRGKAQYRGAPWSAENGGRVALAKGQRAKVLGVDGLTLRVCAEEVNGR
ncbi:MAG: NfeD family protein [Elusimicrobia bacterium]|nr:NfeD family protein [Elusimicrobiota bacterium]